MRITQKKKEKLEAFLGSEKRFMDAFGKIDIDEGWDRFSKETEGERKIVLRALSIWRPLAVAASIVLLVAFAFYMHLIFIQPVPDTIHLSAAAQNATLELNDGSKIFLKDGSMLEYPQKFNRRSREVRLTGEAYFEIMYDKDAPFFVHVGNQEVRVLGTSFDISQTEERIIVRVIEGKVSISAEEEGTDGIVLQAGQEGMVMTGESIYRKQPITSGNFLYWKTRKLNYSKAELKDVLSEIGSFYGVAIIVEDPGIQQYKLTTTFDDQRLDEILDELSFLFNLQFHTETDSIFVTKITQ
jgi:transmembrane sensor